MDIVAIREFGLDCNIPVIILISLCCMFGASGDFRFIYRGGLSEVHLIINMMH